MSEFVHLHCHTEFSLLDGAIRINDLCAKAKDFGMPAAAITDHGNMYGALNFYTACKQYGIDPIIGCEVYVCNDHTDKSSDLARVRQHLILLAQNAEGYRNLLALVSKSWTDGLYYKPRVDKKLLARYSDNLICCSACLAGEVPRNLLGKNPSLPGGGTWNDAKQAAQEYAALFPDRYFLEIQANDLPEQSRLNSRLIELAHELKLPLVATNDCHYLEAKDVEAHDVLLCIQTQKQVDEPDRLRFEAQDLYYKSGAQMAAAFPEVPEAIANTLKIAEMCKGLELQVKAPPYHFPVFEIEPGRAPEDEFRTKAEAGLQDRLDHHPRRDSLDEAAYWERLRMEMDVITSQGFASYFLIVQDFIAWAKQQKIPVGPGRGSGVGSLVAWALGITNLDPIPYKLFFERFLNSERVSMPDFDVDFCEDRRLEVVDYVTRKYGKDKVAQIATFGKMKAKAVVRDVGRALGMSFNETTAICKLIPFDLNMTLQKALDLVPELREMGAADPRVAKLIKISLALEGLNRHASTHAAGVVISDLPMTNYLPLFKGKKDELVTQYDMKMVEKIGLVKFDFLGLRTMTLIDNTLKNIELQNKAVPDLDILPLDDPAVFDLLSRGDTDGLFQVESAGMRKYLRMLRPTCFEDIIAMVALYRPGPLGSGMVDDFCKRKHGEMAVSYPLPILEDCLQETYGVIVYQEQVMQIAQICASYTLGGADLLRRAMGKKKPEEMAMQRSIFLEGAASNGIAEEKAQEIFNLMAQFAEYGFNKSHSAAYALLTYHTSYLKRFFPVEFMSALLSSEIGNQDKLLKYIAVCKDMSIEVHAPSVQESLGAFTPKGKAVLFGLGGIKGVGDEAINEIILARQTDGPYLSFYDLACRVNLRKVSKRVLEKLIKAGACDCFGVSRASLFASLDQVIAKAQKKSKDSNSSQASLLAFAPMPVESALPGIGFVCPEQDVQEWDKDQMLDFEKEALGFYLTGHPLQPFRHDLRRLGYLNLEDTADLARDTRVELAVLITKVTEKLTKKGDRMAWLKVEDLTGHAEVLVFPRTYAEYKGLILRENALIHLTAGVDAAADLDEPEDEEQETVKEIKLKAIALEDLEQACSSNDKPVHLEYPPQCVSPAEASEFKAILQKHKGDCPIYIRFLLEGQPVIMRLGEQWKVRSGPLLYRDVDEWRKTRTGVE